MKQLFVITLAVLLSTIGTASAQGPVSGPGKVTVGVDASTWTSGSPSGPGLIPIGGSGQVNGEFTIATRNGMEIGLRAQLRFLGTLTAFSNQNGKVGIYEADAGFSTGTRATWNYDWHVDLRGAFGVAAGTTLGDYFLLLETDIASALFGDPIPLDLTFGGFIPDDTILYQSSQNPDFGNVEFKAEDVKIYNFRMFLIPKTFSGPPLTVSIQVDVQ